MPQPHFFWIDSHIHLHSPVFRISLPDLLKRAYAEKIYGFLAACVDKNAWKINKQLAKEHAGVLPCFGIHPYCSENVAAKTIPAELEEDIRNHAVAIGEIGMDKYCGVDMERQKAVFELQLVLAERLRLPVVVHWRANWETAFALLDKFQVTGIFHAFSGSLEIASRLIEKGFYLSFGGSTTYDNAHRIFRTLENIPLQSILLETDAPDMAPSGRYFPNLPENLPVIAHRIAHIRGISIDELQQQTTANFFRLFNRLTAEELEKKFN